MAKLTDVRDTPEIANGAKVIAVPVKGGTTIYQGALVALDASGYAIPGKKAESLTAVGRAEETVTNTGADGELVIRVARGVFVFDNTATSANKITAAHVLKPCYSRAASHWREGRSHHSYPRCGASRRRCWPTPSHGSSLALWPSLRRWC